MKILRHFISCFTSSLCPSHSESKPANEAN